MSIESLAALFSGTIFQLIFQVLVVIFSFILWWFTRTVLIEQVAVRVDQYNANLHQWMLQTDILSYLTIFIPLILIRMLTALFVTGISIAGPLAAGAMDLMMVLIIFTIIFSLDRLLKALGISRRLKKPEQLKMIIIYVYGLGVFVSLLFGLNCYYNSVMVLPGDSTVLRLIWTAVCGVAFLAIVFREFRREKNELWLAAADRTRLSRSKSEQLSRSGKESDDKPNVEALTLMEAVLNADSKRLKQLFQQGADVNAMTDDGKLPLIEAVRHNLFDMVVLLRENGGQAELRDKSGWTALTMAACTGQVNIARELIDNGADLNAPDGHGWAPLTWALHGGHKDVENLLIEKGAQTGRSYNYKWARLPDRIAILNFLLNLYQLQIGAGPDSARRFLPTSFDADASSHSYRLEINVDPDADRWLSRIISLSMLGEGSGSKSRCYKVIFDTAWVVKIPPKPITRFEAYSAAVKAERMTVEPLSDDFMCIAPGIADILKKVPGFNTSPDMDAVAAEKQAVTWLMENPDFQEYLKIDKGFAFFMDISRHLFLDQYLKKLHTQKIAAKIKKEMDRQPDLISNPNALEATYGEKNGDLCHHLHDCCLQFEAEMSRLLKTDGNAPQISPYELKTWFVAHVFQQSTDSKQALSPELAQKRTDLLQSLSEEYGNTMAMYRKMVLSRIAAKNFRHNAPQMADVILNLLSLLVKLQERGISMRDLKPGNLFIIDESPDKSSGTTLGIIDFETAIHLDDEGKPGKQPFLGGTPFYATPSHLLDHQSLYELLDEEVAPVYFYQDWYAVVAIIYETVTGRFLFTQTAGALIKLMKTIQRQGKDTSRRKDCFKSESFGFWQAMWQEFDQKTAAEAHRLKTVMLTLPDEFQALLLAAYKKHKQRMYRQRVAAFILSETPFTDQQINQELLASPVRAIRKQRENWKTDTGVPRVKPAMRQKIVAFYDRLISLQQQAEKLAQQFEHLEKDEVTISAGALMEMMLICVYCNMYSNQWQSQQAQGKKTVRESVSAPVETDNPEKNGAIPLQAADDEMNITLSIDWPSQN